MLNGVTRQEGLPSLSDQVTPSVRAKFCQVNVSSGVAEDRFELYLTAFCGGFAFH